MTVSIAYPDWMPPALIDGYGFDHVSPQLRTDFVSGRSMVRRRATSTPARVNVAWMMKDQPAALFEKWFQETLFDGAAWFLCLLKTPIGLDYYRCRFMDIYQGPLLVGGKYWRVSATLELYRRPLLADGAPAYPDPFLQPEFVDLAANREWPEA